MTVAHLRNGRLRNALADDFTMTLAVLSLVLSAAPVFTLEAQALTLREVELERGDRSGVAPVRELRRTAVRLPGLVRALSQRDGAAVVTVCPRTLQRNDFAQDCAVFAVDGHGRARDLRRPGLTAELRAGARSALVWNAALELWEVDLVTLDARRLAEHVLEPHLSADGQRVGIARAEGLTRLVSGFDACPAVLRLSDGAAAAVEGPCRAQAPFVSATGHTVYVSTEGGVAGLVVDGVRRTGHDFGDFVPVPGAQWLWLDGRFAVYAAQYEESTLWLLDAERGEVVPLGEGAQPVVVRDGAKGSAVLVSRGDEVVRLEVAR